MAVGFLQDRFVGTEGMRGVRERLSFHVRQNGFDRCMREIRGADRISTEAIAKLFALWGDPLTVSDEAYMRSCMAEIKAANGPILLCGAGLGAIVFGSICDQSDTSGKQIWCLEHDRHWANVIRSWLTEYQVKRAHIIHAPARLFDNYAWYSVNPQRLAKFQLVICDGARATVKGIMGALLQLGPQLDPHCVLLARNVKEAGDLQTLKNWAKSNGAKFVQVDKQEGFIKLSRTTNVAKVEDLPLPEIGNGQAAAK